MNSAQLPFELGRRVEQQPDTLPFKFTLNDNVAPPKPTKPVAPIKPTIGANWTSAWSAQSTQGACLAVSGQNQALAQNYWAQFVAVAPVSGCLNVEIGTLAWLWLMFVGVSGSTARLHSCWQNHVAFAPKLSGCLKTRIAANQSYANHTTTRQANAPHLTNCTATPTAFTQYFVNGFIAQSSGYHLSGCLKTAVSRSVQPPCEWYPIPIDNTPNRDDCDCACGKPPPPDALPLDFSTQAAKPDAAQVPISFACGKPKVMIPNLDNYMICNEIKAQLADGTSLELLSLNIKADTAGYCWQADLTVSPESFVKVKFRQPEKDVITVLINSERFDFMAEEFSDNRAFGKKSYTITGRSQTALLGADFAHSSAGLVNSESYARQIADSQLKFLNFKIENWQIVDWLVPANVYSLTDKTPIAVLQDIAQTAGGFVASHPYLPQLDIRPIWRVAAWALADTAPDVQVPNSAIVSISGSLQQNLRCHAVGVAANHNQGKAANVYRREHGNTPRATDLSHTLYTDYNVCEAAGVATLSNTGIHKSETVKLPWIPKYGLNRAELGAIWQFNEPAESWRGVVKSVQISVAMNGEVPVIYQTLSVDRYMDI